MSNSHAKPNFLYAVKRPPSPTILHYILCCIHIDTACLALKSCCRRASAPQARKRTPAGSYVLMRSDRLSDLGAGSYVLHAGSYVLHHEDDDSRPGANAKLNKLTHILWLTRRPARTQSLTGRPRHWHPAPRARDLAGRQLCMPPLRAVFSASLSPRSRTCQQRNYHNLW